MSLSDKVVQELDALWIQFHRREVTGSYHTALATARLMLKVVGSFRKSDSPAAMIDTIKRIGRRLLEARPAEICVGNVIRRTLNFIRQEVLQTESIDVENTLYPSVPQRRKGAERAFSLSGLVSIPTPIEESTGSRHAMRDVISSDVEIDEHEMDDDGEDSNEPSSRNHLSTSNYHQCDEYDDSTIFAMEQDDDFVDKSVRSPHSLLLRHPSMGFFAGSEVDAVPSTPLVLESVPSLHDVFEGNAEELRNLMSKSSLDNLKQGLIESVNGLIDEVKLGHMDIAAFSMDHVYSGEVILTYGMSKDVEFFLRHAKERGGREFHVIVAEQEPEFSGHKLAVRLTEAKIKTTVITDAAVFAMMPRVNKVVLGVDVVFANGGLLASSGSEIVCIAARKHAVPVIVCAALYKLSPLYSLDKDMFNEMVEPQKVLPSRIALGMRSVNVINPQFDYIPPELVSLFLTNQGGYNPSYIYRLINEHYHTQDIDLYSTTLGDPSPSRS